MDRRHVLPSIAALAMASLGRESAAQPGSGKPLRIIVPFAPGGSGGSGGSGEITALMLGEFITRKTGQAVVDRRRIELPTSALRTRRSPS